MPNHVTKSTFAKKKIPKVIVYGEQWRAQIVKFEQLS